MCLRMPQFIVFSLFIGNQLFMTSLLHNPPVVKYSNGVAEAAICKIFLLLSASAGIVRCSFLLSYFSFSFAPSRKALPTFSPIT